LSSIALGDADLATESARYFISYVEQDLSLAQEGNFVIAPADLEANIRNIGAIADTLRNNRNDGDRVRAEAVLSSADRVLQQLSLYSAANN
jgi:hypothetical protein